MRQKQKPFFSTLEEIELDMLAREAKKEDHPFEEVLTESVAESIEVRPSTAADVVTEPPFRSIPDKRNSDIGKGKDERELSF